MKLSLFQKDGKILMLAFDHRGSFKKLMNPSDPETVSDQEAINLKREIINSVEDQMSGVLIDIDYGLPGYEDGKKPFLLPFEKSGFEEIPGGRINVIERTAAELIAYGAKGSKLLLYFNPFLVSAGVQMEITKKVLKDSHEHDLPFFLEIVTYENKGLDPAINTGVERAKLVIESVRLMKEEGIEPDVWKLEYPGSFEACEEITKLVGKTPWILLTRGDSFSHFVDQLVVATKAGAAGFLAGRALWQEVCSMKGEQKQHFLNGVLPERFKTISEIALGK